MERTEESRFLFEDAEFSLDAIKKLIAQEYNDAERALTKDRSGPSSQPVVLMVNYPT
jgi:hypothetical protein